jgi:hypothetical protein
MSIKIFHQDSSEIWDISSSVKHEEIFVSFEIYYDETVDTINDVIEALKDYVIIDLSHLITYDENRIAYFNWEGLEFSAKIELAELFQIFEESNFEIVNLINDVNKIVLDIKL